MEPTVSTLVSVLLLAAGALALAVGLLVFARLVAPRRGGRVLNMPYESGMDPIHDTRRRFDVRFYLLAIAFLVFDVEILFLYPWAVTQGQQVRAEGGGRKAESGSSRGQWSLAGGEGAGISKSPNLQNLPPSALRPPPLFSRRVVFLGVMSFVALLVAGFIYDWRKGIFLWR